MFAEEGLVCEAVVVHERDITNRKQQISMHRKWVQAVFRISDAATEVPPKGAAAAPGSGWHPEHSTAAAAPAQSTGRTDCESQPLKLTKLTCATSPREPGSHALGNSEAAAGQQLTGAAGTRAAGTFASSTYDAADHAYAPSNSTWLSGAAGRLASQRGAVPGMTSGRALLPESLDSADEQVGCITGNVVATVETMCVETLSNHPF